MKINPLVLPALLAGLEIATMQPARADAPLSTGTIKAWCGVGHGLKTAVKLAPDTWSRFNYLATSSVNDMAAAKFAAMGDPSVDWNVNLAMGGGGSKAEDVLVSWLREIISNGSSNAFSFVKLPANVDVIRAIAAKLRVAVKNDPQMFWTDTDNIQNTKKALAQFTEFEAAYKKFAPDLAGACTTPQKKTEAKSRAQDAAQSKPQLASPDQNADSGADSANGTANLLTPDIMRRLVATLKDLPANDQNDTTATGFAAFVSVNAAMQKAIKAHGFTAQSWTSAMILISTAVADLAMEKALNNPAMAAQYKANRKAIEVSTDISAADKKQVLAEMDQQMKAVQAMHDQIGPNEAVVRPYLDQLQGNDGG